MLTKEAVIVLVLLTSVNLLNYFDRYIPSATKDLIKEDLRLTDAESGALFTVFVIMYMIVSPAVGLLADTGLFRGRRKLVIFCGVIVWSIATTLTGFMRSFGTLIIPRVLFGVGEAAYATLAPALLCDFISPSHRSLALSVFVGATPIGAAIGYGVAGALGDFVGWRWTFIGLGFLGVVATPILFIREPRPGEMDGEDSSSGAVSPADTPPDAEPTLPITTPAVDAASTTSQSQKTPEPPNSPHSRSLPLIATVPEEAAMLLKKANVSMIKQLLLDLWEIFNNATYNTAVAGYVAVTFGMGGFSDWLPTFFSRYYGFSVGQAGMINGGIVVVGGILGTLSGGLLADLMSKKMGDRFGNPFLLMSGVTMALSSLMAVGVLFWPSANFLPAGVMLFFSVFFGWCYNGPINAQILNSCNSRLRSRANGICVLMIHLLGDAISPTIIGTVSDRTYGDLRGALSLVPASMALCSFIWLCGWITIPYKHTASSISHTAH